MANSSQSEGRKSLLQNRRTALKLLAGSGMVALAGCLGDDDEADDGGDDTGDGGDDTGDGGDDTGDGGETDEELEIIVSSKNHGEQILMGHIAYELLDNNTPHSVRDETNIGGNEEIAEAYQEGDIHVYYDYMGSLWAAHPPENAADEITDPDELYDALKEEMEAEHPLQLTERTAWENTWVPYVETDVAEERDLETVSDLAEYVNDGNYDIQIAIESDFADPGRDDGWVNLTDHYGFEEEHLENWRDEENIIEVDVGLTYDAVMGDADMGIGYGTAGVLADIDHVILEDDEEFWPPYHVVGVVHDDVAEADVLDEIGQFPEILPDAETIQELNYEHEVEGRDEQEVAREFLEDEGWI